MFGYNKSATFLVASLAFMGLLFAAWSHGHSEQKHVSDRTAAIVESLKADLNPEHLTFDDLNRLFAMPGEYNPRESPMGESKFNWDGVVEATFLGSPDAVTGGSTPISLGIGDDKFAGSMMGVRMGCTTAELYEAAKLSGTVPEFVGRSFHIQVTPTWEVAGALEGGRVVSWLSARRYPGGN